MTQGGDITKKKWSQEMTKRSDVVKDKNGNWIPKLQKIVLNKCHGGFGLSDEAEELFWKLLEYPVTFYSTMNDESVTIKKDSPLEIKEDFYHAITHPSFVRNLHRGNKALVEVVERLGEKANGAFASLEVVKIPADIEYNITEYDGYENAQNPVVIYG
tara:strand:- start:343 stop:816 length:474 start_codon:yes stop_codon:yes gene_type:complete